MKKYRGTYFQPDINGEKIEEEISVRLESGFIILEFPPPGKGPVMTFERLSHFWEMCRESGISFTEEVKKEIEEDILKEPVILYDVETACECGECKKCCSVKREDNKGVK